ncbi:hypothetical protein V6N13_008250 [Hibiscus sabdariffa]
MLSLEPFSEDRGRSAVHPRGIPPISFLAPYGFSNLLTRTHVRLLGPCFKTGRMGSPQADARSTLVPKYAETARAGFHDRGDNVSTGISKARAWAATTIRVGPRPEPIGGPALASFSSFPRGTCSLSVSRPYLALDGIYRLIRAAFPNNPTRRQRLVVRQGPGTTGFSPSPAPLSRGLGPSPLLRTLLQTTIRTPRATDSQAGLFPWARLRRTRTANGGATTDDHLFIPIPWRNSRQWLFVLPRGHGFPCHRDREGTGAMKRPHPLPLMFDNTFTGRSARQVSTMILPQCSARAAQNIQGHHRPVIASNFLGLSGHSPSKKLATEDHLRVAS